MAERGHRFKVEADWQAETADAERKVSKAIHSKDPKRCEVIVKVMQQLETKIIQLGKTRQTEAVLLQAKGLVQSIMRKVSTALCETCLEVLLQRKGLGSSSKFGPLLKCIEDTLRLKTLSSEAWHEDATTHVQVLLQNAAALLAHVPNLLINGCAPGKDFQVSPVKLCRHQFADVVSCDEASRSHHDKTH